jgi:hypothetical protein
VFYLKTRGERAEEIIRQKKLQKMPVKAWTEKEYGRYIYKLTVKPVLNGLFIKQNFVFNRNFLRSHDYHSIPWLNGNLASEEKCSGPLRFRLRQVLLYVEVREK